MFNNREIPDQLDATMPEIFPESSPGSFSFVPECNKWVMTVFAVRTLLIMLGDPG